MADNGLESDSGKRIGLTEREGPQPAGMLVRLSALVFDLVLCVCLFAALYFSQYHQMSERGYLFYVLLAVYFISGNLFGTTPGKSLVGLRIVDDGFQRPGVRRGLMRSMAVCLTLAIAGLGYLAGFIDSRSRTLHDILSGTHVVSLSRKGLVLRAFSAWILGFAILFLAALVLPNFMPSSGPSQDAIANSRMRNMATALESYYIDNNMYPMPEQEGWATVSIIGPATGYTPRCLTTPVAHLSFLPDDPFRNARPNLNAPETFAFHYATNPTGCWILVSDGRDGDLDTDLLSFVDPNQCACDPSLFYSYLGGKAIVWDPTNGTISNGDIIRTGP